MEQSADRKKGVWFWVGVTSFCLSAFIWVMDILVNIGSGDIGGLLLVGVLLTAIPIGVGIYGIRRGRIPISGKWWAWTGVRFLSLSAIIGGGLGFVWAEKTWMFILSGLGILGGALLWAFASKRWERYD